LRPSEFQFTKFRTTSQGFDSGCNRGVTSPTLGAIFNFLSKQYESFVTNVSAIYPNRSFIPAAGGLAVGSLLLLGGAFPPGLRGTVKEIDWRGRGGPDTRPNA
jgi:hypothetical protein